MTSEKIAIGIIAVLVLAIMLATPRLPGHCDDPNTATADCRLTNAPGGNRSVNLQSPGRE